MSVPKSLFLFLVSFECIGMHEQGFCQTQTIPPLVTNNFASMFPLAKNIEWRDKLTNYQVFFFSGDTRCEAKFSTDGKWINTEKQIVTDSIPEKIKETLRLSKYADWKIFSAFVLHFPDQPDQYHIRITKDDSPNKILFFNAKGEMLKENASL